MFWSARKSLKLGRITRKHLRLEAQFESGRYVEDFSRRYQSGKPPPSDQIFQDVLEITAHDTHVQIIMRQWKAGSDDLERLYWNLIANGAGQVTAGHFVAASALCFAGTLNYLFSGEASGRSWTEMAWRMISYFENREVSIPS